LRRASRTANLLNQDYSQRNKYLLERLKLGPLFYGILMTSMVY
jgi:hypothetical protein